MLCERHGKYEGTVCKGCTSGAPAARTASVTPIEVPAAESPALTDRQLLMTGLHFLERQTNALEHLALGESGRQLLRVKDLWGELLPHLVDGPAELRPVVTEICRSLGTEPPAFPASSVVIDAAPAQDDELRVARERAEHERREAAEAEARLQELEEKRRHASEGKPPEAPTHN